MSLIEATITMRVEFDYKLLNHFVSAHYSISGTLRYIMDHSNHVFKTLLSFWNLDTKHNAFTACNTLLVEYLNLYLRITMNRFFKN